MEKDKKAILIAMVMGDGYIHKRDRSLIICHSAPQKDYIEYKRDLLHSILGGKRPELRYYLHLDKYPQYRFGKAHKYFRILGKWLYPNKYSKLEYLTPEAIAIWYMDDGSIIANNRYSDGSVRSARTNIHTCTTKEQAEDVCAYFQNKWDIKFTPFNEKGNWSVRCFHREGVKFHELIKPYIIPSMEYKQRFYYGTSAQPLEVKGDDIV